MHKITRWKRKHQNVRQPTSSCGKATEWVFWIGRCPFNLKIIKLTQTEKENHWVENIMTWLVLHTSLCLFFSCSHWIISTLKIIDYNKSQLWRYWIISTLKLLDYLNLENTRLSQLWKIIDYLNLENTGLSQHWKNWIISTLKIMN